MVIEKESKQLIKYNSEVKTHCVYYEKEAIVKDRFISENFRNNNYILKIVEEQTITEARAILKCKTNGIAVPTLYLIDLKNYKIVMENVSGLIVSDFLKDNYNRTEEIIDLLFEIGVKLGEMHAMNVYHGDLNSSNILLKENGSIVLTNFGLSSLEPSINDKVMDLYILELCFNNMHWPIADKFWLILAGYKEVDLTNYTVISKKLKTLKTKLLMVNTTLKYKTSPCTQLKSINELTPNSLLRYKSTDDGSSNYTDSNSHFLKRKTPQHIEKIKTGTEKPCIEIKNSQTKDDIIQLSELKLNIKRIDANNYVSMLSPHSLKVLEVKPQDNTLLKNEPTTPKRRTRKNVDRFSEPVDFKELEELNTPPKTKHIRNTSISSSASKPDSSINILESVTPKRTRKNVDRFGEPVDFKELEELHTPPKTKHIRKTSRSSSASKPDSSINILESVTPKRKRKNVDRFGEPVDFKELEELHTPPKTKHIRKTSISSSASKPDSSINILESVTPKRLRKPVNRFGKVSDLNEMDIVISPRSNKKSRKTSIIYHDEDEDLETDVWTTPVNKHLRQSMTPTTRSGSKVRRSILQDIPENKETEVSITPKTPRKTPKTHVKNLIASVNKRLDSGVMIPCSPLEKARANLHLHAAPKHLPCREVEFKSIHSFLARKINDELTGSMYISGVPGTGKTATVKRVIDSLNTDLIMKHSFKFIEINGLRLANPHQAFSVIWKELTAETVSSSRAQALLNDYFSGNVIRNLSTILLVDEVDHICNRKQDVVYNILDWPSRIGSKVVVITIANTMDLPERVLRGCVTSRMGLTRLVFKPYTFQQLQEIIMNRLAGNSSFDSDAVQLVARKVAAISGDARRALDICRRAIDLIKSEDDVQLITINHVNQVLNSILSGVRVTAIRYCSLFEQFFLRALRDETIRTGFDHSTIDSIYTHMKSICLLEGEQLPNDQQVIMMAYRLRDNGLIFLEKKRMDVFRKVSLNVSPEDINYALEKYNN